MGFVLEVLIAKASFENAGFRAGANDLERNDDEKSEEVVGLIQEEEQADDNHRAEDVDGIADAGVEAVGDELACLRGDGKRIAELEAGYGDEQEAEEHDDEACDAERGPGTMRIKIDEIGDANERGEDEE